MSKTMEFFKSFISKDETIQGLIWKFHMTIESGLVNIENVKDILKNSSIDENIYFEKIQSSKVKDELKQLTNNAFEKDIFGAPTFVVNDKISIAGNTATSSATYPPIVDYVITAADLETGNLDYVDLVELEAGEYVNVNGLQFTANERVAASEIHAAYLSYDAASGAGEFGATAVTQADVEAAADNANVVDTTVVHKADTWAAAKWHLITDEDWDADYGDMNTPNMLLNEQAGFTENAGKLDCGTGIVVNVVHKSFANNGLRADYILDNSGKYPYGMNLLTVYDKEGLDYKMLMAHNSDYASKLAGLYADDSGVATTWDLGLPMLNGANLSGLELNLSAVTSLNNASDSAYILSRSGSLNFSIIDVTVMASVAISIEKSAISIPTVKLYSGIR